METATFTKRNVKDLIHDSSWSIYKKKVPTKALKINGSFTVETSEGIINCEDGYLCLDARGYPYPVATEEFKLIYEIVPEDKQSKTAPSILPKQSTTDGKNITIRS